MVTVYRDRSMIRYESLVNFKIESQTKSDFPMHSGTKNIFPTTTFNSNQSTAQNISRVLKKIP